MGARVKGKTPVQVALRTLREKLNMTQQEFSNALGVTMITVCRWETSRPPSGQSLVRLALFALGRGELEANEIFRNALRDDLGWNDDDDDTWLPAVKEALWAVHAGKAEDPAVQRGYLRVVRAIRDAHALLLKAAHLREINAQYDDLEDDGSEWYKVQVEKYKERVKEHQELQRRHEDLEWELEYEEKRMRAKRSKPHAEKSTKTEG
jgi:transcriptional regulator with XRE-family HTH domain